jgi:hypothetical protein
MEHRWLSNHEDGVKIVVVQHQVICQVLSFDSIRAYRLIHQAAVDCQRINIYNGVSSAYCR